MTFKRVLIANRGEIALRVVRACRDAGLTSIAVYADPDAGAPYAQLADEAVALGGSTAADSYLDIGRLLAAAGQTAADAVHPGYGFLAENADFAQAVMDAGLTWIGPPPGVIRALGDKVQARAIARQAGAPLVPGTTAPVADAAQARQFAEQHGLPIAIKAAHGGGGRGLRIVRDLDEVVPLFDAAVREATAAFGRGECFVEAYVERGRHVEAQVLADTLGTVVVVGTRDCTLQRRYQKLVEEAPAPFLTDPQQDLLERSAAAICAAAGYVNAGTVEFLLSPRGELSFLEVNTRLQVEHSATEESTDTDLVRAQLLIAAGHTVAAALGPGPRGRRPVTVARRHAIEFRVNAEQPGQGFAPSTGTITGLRVPSGPGIRAGFRDRGWQRGRRAVRLAAGQADRDRPGPAAGAGTGPPRAGRVRGHRRADHAAVLPRGAGRARVHRRRAGRLRRAHPVDRAGLPAQPGRRWRPGRRRVSGQLRGGEPGGRGAGPDRPSLAHRGCARPGPGARGPARPGPAAGPRTSGTSWPGGRRHHQCAHAGHRAPGRGGRR